MSNIGSTYNCNNNNHNQEKKSKNQFSNSSLIVIFVFHDDDENTKYKNGARFMDAIDVEKKIGKMITRSALSHSGPEKLKKSRQKNS